MHATERRLFYLYVHIYTMQKFNKVLLGDYHSSFPKVYRINLRANQEN